MREPKRKKPSWVTSDNSMLFSFGFIAGVMIGTPIVLLLLYKYLERDSLGLILTAITFVVAIGIAMAQIALGVVARRESNHSLMSIERNLSYPLPGTFKLVFESVHRIVVEAFENHHAVLDLGWPVHNIGNTANSTKGSDAHKELRRALRSRIGEGCATQLCTLPLVLFRTNRTPVSPILTLFEIAANSSGDEYHKDVDGNFRDELEWLRELVEAAEGSDVYQDSGESPLKLMWGEKAPVHWSYSLSRDGFEHGVLFTAAAAQDRESLEDTSRAEVFISRSSEGMNVQGKAGRLLMRVSESVVGHDSIDVFKRVEPRLLRMLLTYAVQRLAVDNRPRTIINELGESIFAADHLVYWDYEEDASGIQRRAAYVWRAGDSSRVLVVVPSAAGLYAMWRDDENSLHEVRFARYLRLCEELRDRCSCNVVLLSQGGQAGYGRWSPERSCDELRQALSKINMIVDATGQEADEDAPGGFHADRVVVFGVCTGGLGALTAFRDGVVRRKDGMARVDGVAVWDLASDPGFRRKNIQAVERRYNLRLGPQDEFRRDRIEFGAAVALDCVSVIPGDGVKRFWVGGVMKQGVLPEESTRRTHGWARIKVIADKLGGACEVHGFGDLGHIPGGPFEDELESFWISLSDWANRVFASDPVAS